MCVLLQYLLQSRSRGGGGEQWRPGTTRDYELEAGVNCVCPSFFFSRTYSIDTRKVGCVSMSPLLLQDRCVSQCRCVWGFICLRTPSRAPWRRTLPPACANRAAYPDTPPG